MSSITISSSTSILAALAKWNIFFWSWTDRSSYFGFVASLFKPTFRK
jgi:hypothetical protein